MADNPTIAKALDEIQSIYSYWNPDEKELSYWAEYLSDTEVENEFLVKAVKAFIKNAINSYRPALSEILYLCRVIKEKETPKPDWTGFETPLTRALAEKSYVPKPPRPGSQPRA